MGERQLLEEVLSLVLQRISVEENVRSSEQELVAVVRGLEAGRQRWLNAELQLQEHELLLKHTKEQLLRSEVQLKHSRNQLDLELRKRCRIERDYHYLQRQMQLMCDILVQDSKTSAGLNAEQKSLLATFEHKAGNATLHRTTRRLRVVDESSFLSHSDISYDRTDDDVDLDTSGIKPLRPRAREKRRSSLGPGSGAADRRRGRSGNISAEPPGRMLEQEVETVVKASVQTPDSGEIHMEQGNTQRTQRNQRNPLQPPLTQQTHPQESFVPPEGDQTSVWFPANKTLLEPKPESKMEESVAVRALYQNPLERTLKHEFLSKTVIMPETCSPCGKRIRFGRMAVKCRTCRAVAHPECKMRFSSDCSTIPPQGGGDTQNSLEDFSPGAPPWVPHLMVECVAEIERRGLQERGLYRVPGGERLVKELRMMVLQGKTPPLGKVQDVHVLCGFLKDFLRNLKEPLLTFRLHRTFMEAAELQDEDSSTAAVYRALSELPPPHRDTLAFLMLHLQKVVRSPPCQMDQNNLSWVFGPTLVGHGTPDPSPTTILRETSTQPKVVVRLLSLPEVYWRRVLSAQKDQLSVPGLAQKDQLSVPGLAQKDQISVPGLAQKDQISVPGSALGPEAAGRGRFFQPLTSPELSSCYRNPIRGTLRGGPRNPGLSNLGRTDLGRKFFDLPSAF